jgi:hypothetical protein
MIDGSMGVELQYCDITDLIETFIKKIEVKSFEIKYLTIFFLYNYLLKINDDFISFIRSG